MVNNLKKITELKEQRQDHVAEAIFTSEILKLKSNTKKFQSSHF